MNILYEHIRNKLHYIRKETIPLQKKYFPSPLGTKLCAELETPSYAKFIPNVKFEQVQLKSLKEVLFCLELEIELALKVLIFY